MSDPRAPEGRRDPGLVEASARLAEAVEQQQSEREAPGEDSGVQRRRLAWAVVAMTAIGLALAWWRSPGEQPAPPPQTQRHVFFADVEGWYRQTPAEVALATPFDLALPALPEGLPLSLGPWLGNERKPDPAVDTWFRDPPVAIERTYRREDGELVWLSAFGHEGRPSFHLFEHTPEICYPLGGWRVQHFGPAKLQVGAGPRPFTVNHGVADKPDGSQLVFLFFYLWDQPARDPDRGVLSVRISSPVTESPERTLALLEEDFLGRLFETTLAWRRF